MVQEGFSFHHEVSRGAAWERRKRARTRLRDAAEGPLTENLAWREDPCRVWYIAQPSAACLLSQVASGEAEISLKRVSGSCQTLIIPQGRVGTHPCFDTLM